MCPAPPDPPAALSFPVLVSTRTALSASGADQFAGAREKKGAGVSRGSGAGGREKKGAGVGRGPG